jgi:aryl-alcohol dehydrogenase-like predicted oxidoreductase
VPIPGTTKRHRLEENIAAANVRLAADEMRDIDRSLSEIEVRGARYSDSLQRLIDR